MQVWSNANWNFHYPQTADRRRLTALARDRNATQKHVWRAEIVLLSADGVGTNEIMRRTGRQLGEERHSASVELGDERSQIFGGTRPLKRLSILASFCQLYNYKSLVSIIAISSAVGVSHRRLEWQTFAGIALAVHSGPSPVIV